MDLLDMRNRPHMRCIKQVEDEVSGVLELIMDLSRGQGPSISDVDKWTGFWAIVLKRVENFCTKMLESDYTAADGVVVRAGTQLVGAPALRVMFTDVQRKMAFAVPSAELTEIQPLKTYRWMLDTDQQLLVKTWVGSLACKLVKAYHSDGGGAPAGAPSSSSSAAGASSTAENMQLVVAGASSSSGSVATHNHKPKKQKDKETKVAETHQSMMRFFHGPRKASKQLQ